jgi:hypothetical protein
MKTLFVRGDEYQAEKIVKTNTSIVGYVGKLEIFAFRGIKDFSQFQLAEGQEWDMSEEDKKSQRILDLELAMASILGGGI